MGDQEHDVLTKDKLTQILRKLEKTKDVEILKLSVKPGTEAGDNYASEIAKCDMTARVGGNEEKEYHWMVKMSPVITSFTVGMHLEENEVIYYDEMAPKWNGIAAERKASFRLNSFAAPYTELPKDDSGRSILAMENLTYQGYTDAPHKKKGLSLAHAKVALEEIARFHALGYVYMKTYPGGLDKAHADNEVFLTDYVYVKPSDAMKSMFESFMSTFFVAVKAIQEPGQDLVTIFDKFNDAHDPVKYIKEMFTAQPDKFNLICHGDLWFNNMLFKHEDDGTPTKCSLLDISMCKWANPCTDLAYFLFSSTTPMLRETHLDDLLGHYHDTFTWCLWQLNEDPTVYPYRQLLKDYNTYSFVGFWFAFFGLPLVLAKKEDAIGQETFSGDITNPEQAQDITDRAVTKMLRAVQNEPQLKIMLHSAFMEMIKRGVFRS